MSNHEIEDVLSSIRRLVSEDLRPAPAGLAVATVSMPAAPTATPQTATPTAAPADKLMLTPALRVVEDATVAAPAAVEDVVARLGAAVPDEDWESPLGDDGIWQDDHLAEVHDLSGFVHRARPAPLQEQVAEEDFLDPPGLDASGTDFARADEILDDDVPFDDLAGGDAARVPGDMPRQVEPPQDAAWADAAEAEILADLAQETEAAVTGTLLEDEAAMVFDEEVLRDLVRDLIREELAGTLGERITRNVRKLVRAEIARALALRDFD